MRIYLDEESNKYNTPVNELYAHAMCRGILHCNYVILRHRLKNVSRPVWMFSVHIKLKEKRSRILCDLLGNDEFLNRVS